MSDWAPLDDRGDESRRDAPPAPPPPTPGWQAPPPPPPGMQLPPGWHATGGLPLVGGAFGAKAGSARTGPLPLHPMTLGDVLDGAFKLFKANARTLLLVTSAVVVPLQLISAFALRSQFDVGLLSVFRDPTIAESIAEEQQSVSQLAITLLTVVLASLVTPFVAGAVARVVAGSYLGREVTAGEALRTAGRRFPALLGSFILVHLLELPAFVACILPGFAVMAMFVLVAPAIAVEEISAVAAMRRSWRLVRPRFWAVLGISLLAGFIANTLGQILGTVPALIAVVLGGQFAWLGVAASGVLSQIVSLPIVTIAATLLYFDARIRHEGFDLQVMASELASGRHVAR